MLNIVKVGESSICYFSNPCQWTREYYLYCVNLVRIALKERVDPINVILGNIEFEFNNEYPVFRIDIQSEHTLVKLGGRSVDEVVYGDIDIIDEYGKYLIRVPNYEYYSNLDATIEYSLPNIANLKTNDRFEDYLKSAIYVAPVIYDTPSFESHIRSDIITMFSSNPCERRSDFVFNVSRNQIDMFNVQNIFNKNDLKKVYHNTKIMVNVHQTDHHHTFEELRVLPALCNGVIVISEDVPLKDEIPYADSIIWSPYEELATTLKEVNNNYEQYRQEIFTDELKKKLKDLHDSNINRVLGGI